MQLKKIAGILLILTGVFFFGDQIKAAAMSAYTPLVSIPGVGSPKNISQYLVGLYNFLLSIVGIVAVLMFIIGGFKYLTAAGNPSAATDAKDTIYNAAYGLILAIMSWVIVSTINPDVLVIKKPGGMTTGTWNPVCTTSDATVGPPASCECVDGTTTLASAVGSCDTDCKNAGKCTTRRSSCIASGSSNNGDTSGICKCIDGASVPKGASATCQAACGVNDCFFADMRIGIISVDDQQSYTYGTDYIGRARAYATYDTTYDKPYEFNVKDVASCSEALAVNAADYTTIPPRAANCGNPTDGFCPPTNCFQQEDPDCAPITYSLGIDNFGGPPKILTTPAAFPGTAYPTFVMNLPGAVGYEGVLACNYPWFNQLLAEPACKYEFWSASVQCPVTLAVDYGTQKRMFSTKYLKFYKPN